MSTAADAIDACVERFVREILAVIEQAREERRVAALNVVAAAAPHAPGAGSAARATGRGTEAPATVRQPETTAPAKAEAPSAKRGGAVKTRATVSRPAPERRGSKAAPTSTESPASAKASWTTQQPETSALSATASSVPTPAHGMKTDVNERESIVLAAVRALVRATAGEVAAHAGQPNGSVSVALRALVARGQVARTETSRGIEYGLVSPGGIQPFKRVRAAAPEGRTEALASAAAGDAPASTATSLGSVPPPGSAPSPSPVAQPKRAPKRRPPNNPQLSLFDLPPPEPKR